MSVGLPAATCRARQRHSIAMPPSIAASLDPVVDVPIVFAASGEFQRSARMCTQRASISAVCGYSSLSTMFLSSVDGHDLADLGLDPGLAERRQVLARVAVEHQLVADDLEDVAWILLLVGHPVLRQRHREVARGEDVVLERVTDAVLGVQHGVPPSGSEPRKLVDVVKRFGGT